MYFLLYLNRWLQHGQNIPSNFIKISQNLQRFSPLTYRFLLLSICDLYFVQIPSQLIPMCPCRYIFHRKIESHLVQSCRNAHSILHRIWSNILVVLSFPLRFSHTIRTYTIKRNRHAIGIFCHTSTTFAFPLKKIIRVKISCVLIQYAHTR